MRDERAQVTVVILENRQMIASILADLLTAAGFAVRAVPRTADVREALHQSLPAVLLADLGVASQDDVTEWQSVKILAEAFGVPVIPYSCAPLSGAEGVPVLRSPGDFAAVAGKVELALRRRRSPLGMILVDAGHLTLEEMETALHIQKELAQVGRKYLLGDLLVRLGIVSPESLLQALEEQEKGHGAAGHRRGPGAREA